MPYIGFTCQVITAHYLTPIFFIGYNITTIDPEGCYLRASHLFAPTLREVPSDAELISHRLLLRAGFIRKLAAGVYSYLPLGWKVHQKISQIVREEMNAIGGQEMLMPSLVPSELMEESGRIGVDVLFHLKDRSLRDFVLGFTHEEVITDIARNSMRSWRQLPILLYQIQTKFRDEPRPRGGLVRVREFTMKDGYSFDYDEEGMDRQYQANYKAYCTIFTRCGLEYLAVDADAGAIGGSVNKEFMLLADSGEDTVLQCDACGYAVNAERADIGASLTENNVDSCKSTKTGGEVVSTPEMHTVQQVCEFLKVSPQRLIKTIIVTAGEQPIAALVRGDRELNLSKLGRHLGKPVQMATPDVIERVTGAPVGYAGPVGLNGVPIIADNELKGSKDMVVGANEANAHRIHVTPEIDFKITQWNDIRTATAGDRCGQPSCNGSYRETRGIEVGHIFKLGVKYSQAMNAKIQNEKGEMQDILMGCYGLGISRVMASAIEAHHDDDGIIWPISIAPYEVVIIPVNPSDELQCQAAEKLYDQLLSKGVDALLDDRKERSGVKFNDADLVGYPVRVVIGRSLQEGKFEISLRREKSKRELVPIEDAPSYIASLVLKLKSELN